jgi:methylthioxylose transferase
LTAYRILTGAEFLRVSDGSSFHPVTSADLLYGRAVSRARWTVLGALVLPALAVVVGAFLGGDRTFAGFPPLFANWQPHVGVGTPLALLVAVLVVAKGPELAARLPWRRALLVGYLTALTWTISLSLVDGWDRGFAGRLTTSDEYLHEVPGVTDIGVMVRGFSARILDYQPDSWTTHVSGHPPGALLAFVGLDRIGLSGGAWAALLCVLVGALAAVAVPVTLRAWGNDEAAARAVLPFAALFPGAVWIGVSADGLFAGVTACGIALLALGRPLLAGLLLGLGIFLSYGLVLVGVLALAVAWRQWRTLVWAVTGAVVVVAVFALAGFWWLDGYHLVVDRYYQGIASSRVYYYWVWANLAAALTAAGLAPIAGLAAARRAPALWLAGAGLAAILLADLSGLSKAEVERIWLPFTVWLTAATAFLPAATRKPWLAVQAGTALAVNHLLLTNW